MTASFKSKGTFANGIGAVVPGLPGNLSDGDFMLLFVESANQAASAPSGWDAIPTPSGNHFRGTAGAAGGVRLDIFSRPWQSGDTAPTVADTGDHTTAIICAYCGVDLKNPFGGVTPIGFNAAASTTLTLNGITTGADNDLVILAAARDVDAASTNGVTGALTNAGLIRKAERHDQTVTDGTGGGLFVGDGLREAAGATGNTTATQTSSAWGGITLVLRARPAPSYIIKAQDIAGAGESMIAGAFTNVAGRLLVALVGCNQDTNDHDDLTISDTEGLTWTRRAAASAGDFTASGVIWTAIANGNNTTVTVAENGGGTMVGGLLVVLEVANGAIGATGSVGIPTNDGLQSFNLSATPAPDSLIVSCTGADDDAGASTAGAILAANGMETIAEEWQNVPEFRGEVAERVGGGIVISWNYADAGLFAKGAAALEITYTAKAPPPRPFPLAPSQHMLIR